MFTIRSTNCYCLTQNLYKSMQKAQRATTKTLLIMKFTAILLVAGFLQVSANGFSQRVTLSRNNVPLDKIFRDIKSQTGYAFFFDESWLKQAARVTIRVNDLPLEQALDICFRSQPLT